MIVVGNLRRTITISRLTKTRDQYGSETDVYNNVMTLKAELLTQKGNLVKNSLELFAQSTLTFLIYYRTILFTDRITYENQVYRIIDIDEINFREQLKLTVQLINV
jgi:head-tail adaptor